MTRPAHDPAAPGDERDRRADVESPQALLDLGLVPVALDGVRGHVLREVDERGPLARATARPGDPGLRVDHHRLDPAALRERRQRQ